MIKLVAGLCLTAPAVAHANRTDDTRRVLTHVIDLTAHSDHRLVRLLDQRQKVFAAITAEFAKEHPDYHQIERLHMQARELSIEIKQQSMKAEQSILRQMPPADRAVYLRTLYPNAPMLVMPD